MKIGQKHRMWLFADPFLGRTSRIGDSHYRKETILVLIICFLHD
jgi:hypothetical protein